MLFVLRSETEPHRVLREIDDRGTERTFYLWPDGRWVVALRTPEGEVACARAAGIQADLREAGSVTVIAVAENPG
ncbi:MAG: hypothetical protein ACXVEF_14610 [Polyangiales bacterium]